MEDKKDLKKNEKEKKEEVTPLEGTGEGDKFKTPQVTLDAIAAAERMEKANERTAELLAQQQDLVARKALGGESFAGQTPEPKKPETDDELFEKVKKGETTLFK